MFSRLNILGFWHACELADVSRAKVVAAKVLEFKDMYDTVQAKTAVPWYVIGAIDYREEDFDHAAYLGNGDPLNQVTVNVPKGRGPFPDWQSGTVDALTFDGFDRLPSGAHWDIVTALVKCDAYNGMGYDDKGLRSPYVWAGTNMQQRGKYTADGYFDPNAWDTQLGVAAIFLALKTFHGVDLSEG